MARQVAIEWDAREARVVIGSEKGSELVVEKTIAIPLGPRSPGETFSDPDTGKALAATLSAEGISAGEVLVAVGRSSIELRNLSLPPAPPEDMPDMVRFQAMRSFTAIGEEWPVDFVPLTASDEGANQVIAATISPDVVKQIRKVCEAAGLSVKRLILRPFATASLLRRHGAASGSECCLAVDRLADEADLTVLADGKVVFVRTVKLPADLAAQTQALQGEVRRTIGAAQNQMGGRRVQRVVICGDASTEQELSDAVAELTSLPAEVFDPLGKVRLGKALKNNLPEREGRFVPLIGLLSDEVAGQAHDIDFLNPRKRPEPPSKTGKRTVYGVAISAVLVLCVLTYVMKLRSLDQQILSLRNDSLALDKTVERSQKLMSQLDDVNQWQANDVTWSDELRSAATRLRQVSEDKFGRPTMDVGTVITELTAGISNVDGIGGEMTLKGYAQDSSTITRIEQALSYEGNRVLGKGAIYDGQRKEYRWFFDERILVAPDTLGMGRPLGRPYLQAAPASKSAAPGATQPETEPPTADDEKTAAKEEASPAVVPEPDAQPVSKQVSPKGS